MRPRLGTVRAHVTALVDTGASMTSIDGGVAEALGLPAVSAAKVQTASGLALQAVYSAALTIATSPPQDLDPIPVLGAALASQGLIALIGRDLLARMTLIYVGPEGHWLLSW